MKSQKLSPFVNMAVKTAFAKLSVSNTVNSNKVKPSNNGNIHYG